MAKKYNTRKIRIPRSKRKVVTASREFLNLVIDLQSRAKKQGKYLSQTRATKLIANTFKKRGIRLDDNFIWLG